MIRKCIEDVLGHQKIIFKECPTYKEQIVMFYVLWNIHFEILYSSVCPPDVWLLSEWYVWESLCQIRSFLDMTFWEISFPKQVLSRNIFIFLILHCLFASNLQCCVQNLLKKLKYKNHFCSYFSSNLSHYPALSITVRTSLGDHLQECYRSFKNSLWMG